MTDFAYRLPTLSTDELRTTLRLQAQMLELALDAPGMPPAATAAEVRRILEFGLDVARELEGREP